MCDLSLIDISLCSRTWLIGKVYRTSVVCWYFSGNTFIFVPLKLLNTVVHSKNQTFNSAIVHKMKSTSFPFYCLFSVSLRFSEVSRTVNPFILFCCSGWNLRLWGASEMSRLVKLLVAKPGYPSLIPETHKMEETLSPLTCTCVVAHTQPHP